MRPLPSHLVRLALGLLLISCNHKPPGPTPARLKLEQDAAIVFHIVPGPELSRESAEKVISFYFLNHISGCGGMYSLADEGDYWSARIAIGVAGTIHPEPIRLQKATGQISWVGGDGWPASPTYRSIAELVQGTLSRPQQSA